MSMIDDDFFSVVMLEFNTMISLMIITIRITTKEYLGNYHYQSARNLFGMQGPLKDLRPQIKFW